MKYILISCLFMSLISTSTASTTGIKLKDTDALIKKGNTMKTIQIDKKFFDLEKFPEDDLLV